MPETPDSPQSPNDPNPPSFTQPVSAKLARRLAAAADGYRDGREVWFTASFTPKDGQNGNNFDISEAIPGDGTSAPDVTLSDGYGLFGPFLTEESGDPKRTPIASIVLRLPGGDVEIDASKYDAMFWSSSSLDKFAVPHYATVLDLSMAAKLQREFSEPSVYLVLHGPNTEYDLKSIPNLGGQVKFLTI
jgi:hypothetical protein